MADSFYPFIGSPEDYEFEVSNELPLLKELAFDFESGEFIIDEVSGDIKVVTGKEALRIWIYKAIFTNRYVHEVYSWDYGTELATLIGQRFSRGLTESEAFRFISEALLINPYIDDVINNKITFSGDILHINITVISRYGEVIFNVWR